jgi:hypothetical protein
LEVSLPRCRKKTFELEELGSEKGEILCCGDEVERLSPS